MSGADTEREAQASGEEGITGTDVRHALECLHDPTALACTVLAYYYPEIAAIEDALDRGQALRALVFDSVEALRPLQRSEGYAQSLRYYDTLRLRYASGMGVEQIAYQLNVGSRQIYRDLRRAEEKLREVMSSRALAARLGGSRQARATAMREEIACMRARPLTVAAADVLLAAVSATESLAHARGVRVGVDIPPGPLIIRGTPGILRTAMIQLLSHVIQAVSDTEVTACLGCVGRTPQLTVSLAGQCGVPPWLRESLNSVQAAGIECVLQELPGGRWQVIMMLPPAQQQHVLVAEDNPGAVDLYERYLQGTEWQVSAVGLAAEVLPAVRQHHPDLVLLDIMMPDLDGWTVLQNLRMDPATAGTPVVVCSVVYDPGLAEALGSSAYLTKPVSRPQLLTTLRQCLQAAVRG